MSRPKRGSGSTPHDRLIGIRPREKTDFFAGCNERGSPAFQRDPNAFMMRYCQICKNTNCIRARGFSATWEGRMQHQVEYLLNDPQFSDLTSEEHLAFAAMAFESLNAKANRLEIASRRQDWVIPEEEEGPTDGFAKISTSEATAEFDQSVRALARRRDGGEEGAEAEETSSARDPSMPEHFVGEDSLFEYETEYPSSDGKRVYRVALTRDDKWSCACEGFKHTAKCKHLDTVRAWYEDDMRAKAEAKTRAQEEAEETSARDAARTHIVNRAPDPPPLSPADPRVPMQRRINTPMPTEGIMLDGSVPPPPELIRPKPAEPVDPWAIKRDPVVEPGATIKLTRKKR